MGGGGDKRSLIGPGQAALLGCLLFAPAAQYALNVSLVSINVCSMNASIFGGSVTLNVTVFGHWAFKEMSKLKGGP